MPAKMTLDAHTREMEERIQILQCEVDFWKAVSHREIPFQVPGQYSDREAGKSWLDLNDLNED